MAKGDPVAGGEQQPRLERCGSRLLGIDEREPPELHGIERPRRDRGELDKIACVFRQRSQRRPHRPEQARRHVVPASPERPRGLHGQQRIAFGALEHPRHVRLGQACRLARQRRHRLGPERPQLEFARQQAAGAKRLLEAVGVRAAGQLPAGHHDHHPQRVRRGARRSRQARGSVRRRCARPRAQAAPAPVAPPIPAARPPPRTAGSAGGLAPRLSSARRCVRSGRAARTSGPPGRPARPPREAARRAPGAARGSAPPTG